jgi:hypothetical protein
MAVVFQVRGREVYVRVSGSPTHAELLRASNKLLTYLARGYRFPQNPRLRPGKKRFRLARVTGVVRELAIDELLGLEVLTEPPITILGEGRFVWCLPDWELLNYWRSTFVTETVDRRPVELPTGADGRVRRFLIARHVRCLAEWSQSKIEKYAAECPGLLKTPGQFGVPWAVETVEFLRHFGDPQYPFLPRPWRPARPIS